MNYRERYKKHYKINFGKEYDIHHIDFDRNNNSISNLLLLPKTLHLKYHAYKKEYDIVISSGLSLKLNYNSTMQRNLQLYCQEKLLDIVSEIQDWIMMKFFEDKGIEKYNDFRS